MPFDKDVQLMLAVKSGDNASFEILLKKYFPMVLNFVYRYLGDRDIAEDLTQEVFIRVYQHAAGYLPRAQFKTWLLTIARNISLNELRRNKKRPLSWDAAVSADGEHLPGQIEDKKALPADQSLIRAETIQAVKKAILSLPEKQRAAIILRRYQNFSYQEIAEAMRISEKAVKSILSRGRENLRKQLSGITRG